jgi:beta-phosphoglucomutase-like phosphatase (HAD superfamily)
MDGTIIDTDHIWKKSNAPILDSHAPHLSQEEKEKISGCFLEKTIYEVWQCVHEHCNNQISMDEITVENIKHLHTAYLKDGIDFIPYFQDFHAQVVELGLKHAVATSSQQETVDTIRQIVPLHDYFDQHIYHADHVNRAYKPSPAVYLYAAEQLAVDPKKCIAIEDSSGGIKAAKAAGMYCIGINTGKNREQLKQADAIVESFTEIDLKKLLYE